MSQLTLFDGISDAGFLRYHFDNPHIYDAFRSYALRAIARGYRHWGAKGVFEVIRWESAVRGDDEFKINNNYTPLYARLFMNEHPEHEGFFRLRDSRFDAVVGSAAGAMV